MGEIYGNRQIHEKAETILKDFYGEEAVFRDGQYEAIEATMTQRRTLVVQRTGWGKSLIYFVCTKLLREQKRGVTMVVSPLLVLMENQIAAAEKLKLSCDVLNSTVRDRRRQILDALEEDRLDLLFITPETLFSDDVQSRLHNIRHRSFCDRRSTLYFRLGSRFPPGIRKSEKNRQQASGKCSRSGDDSHGKRPGDRRSETAAGKRCLRLQRSADPGFAVYTGHESARQNSSLRVDSGKCAEAARKRNHLLPYTA